MKKDIVMTQIEQIKSEIERYISHYEKIDRNDFNNGEMYICQELLSFIESLEKEQGHKLDKILFPIENIFDMASTLVNLSYEGFSLLDKELKREYGRHIELNRVEESTSKIKGWVARDKAEEFEEIGYLHLFASKPHREYGCSWIGTSCYLFLDKTMFPDLKWEDDPIKVELTISQV